MSRLGLFFCAFSLFACGADSATKRPTEAVAVPIVDTNLAVYWVPGASAPQLWILGQGLRVLNTDARAAPHAITETLDKPLFIDVQFDTVWVANRNQLVAVDARSRSRSEPVTIAEDAQISAIEGASQGTVFVADARANRIVAVTGDKIETLTEGEALHHPDALLLDGGSLIIGSEAGLQSFNIKTGESKQLTGDLKEVVALTHDHLGYFIAATATGEVRQVKPDGTSRLLHTLDKAPTGIAFDHKTRALYFPTGEEIIVLDYLALTGEDKSLWAARDQRLMRPFRKNGMALAGGEYWPSHGTKNVSYPDDILWGFYPSPDEVIEGSAAAVAPPAAAIACAEKSYRALQAFVDSNPPAFHSAAEASGASKQFYLWINDYSDAAKEFPHEQRMNKFWYWERTPAVLGRVPGFWKWETTLLQDGSCLWPQGQQIAQYLQEKISTPAAAKTETP